MIFPRTANGGRGHSAGGGQPAHGSTPTELIARDQRAGRGHLGGLGNDDAVVGGRRRQRPKAAALVGLAHHDALGRRARQVKVRQALGAVADPAHVALAPEKRERNLFITSGQFTSENLFSTSG